MRVFTAVLFMALASALFARTVQDNQSQTLNGYLVDVMCGAKHASEGAAFGSQYTKKCLNMPACVQSGYALLTADNHLLHFDSKGNEQATKLIAATDREKRFPLCCGDGQHVRQRSPRSRYCSELGSSGGYDSGSGGLGRLATRYGLPVSTTHAIVGSVVGVTTIAYGFAGMRWDVLSAKVALPLLFSPFASLILTSAALRTWNRISPLSAPDCLCAEVIKTPVALATATSTLDVLLNTLLG